MRGRDTGTDSDRSGQAPRFVAPTRSQIPESDLHGSWVQPTPRRLLGHVVLAVALLGATGGLYLTLRVQTFDALAILVGFTIVFLITWTALSASMPTRVSLDGPLVVVRRGREVDEFDLAGPIRRIVEVGRPNRPNWRVRLETSDGKVVELGPTQIDPDLMHAAMARYRAPKIPRQRTGD